MASIGNIVVGIFVGSLFLLLSVGGTGCVVVGLKKAYEALRVVLIGETDAVNVESGGWYIVQGDVQADETVAAPLSGREAACAVSRIEELRRTRYTTSWVPQHERVDGGPFEIADSTGTARVDPTDATVRVDDEAKTYEYPDSTEDFKDFVSKFDLDEPPNVRNSRYAEERVRDGDTVLVLGSVSSQGGIPTFSGDVTLTTHGPRTAVLKRVGSAAKWIAMGLVLLFIPGLFVFSFLVPYLLGS